MSLNPLGPHVTGWTAPPAPRDVTLEGRHVGIEPLAQAHADDLWNALRGQDSLWDYMNAGPFADRGALSDYLASCAASEDTVFVALRDRATGRVQGIASYLRIAPEAGSIEVGNITFAPALQRTRAATEAMALMMGWAFGAGYRRYEWKCNALNLPSRRAAQRLGFSYEGVFRQALVVKGRNRDTAWFAAIDAEWPRLKSAYDTWLDPANFDAEGRQHVSLSALTAPILAARDPAL
jgi:RimJ/RimL family protein N-acetyltransferase